MNSSYGKDCVSQHSVQWIAVYGTIYRFYRNPPVIFMGKSMVFRFSPETPSQQIAEIRAVSISRDSLRPSALPGTFWDIIAVAIKLQLKEIYISGSYLYHDTVTVYVYIYITYIYKIVCTYTHYHTFCFFQIKISGSLHDPKNQPSAIIGCKHCRGLNLQYPFECSKVLLHKHDFFLDHYVPQNPTRSATRRKGPPTSATELLSGSPSLGRSICPRVASQNGHAILSSWLVTLWS